MTPQSPTAQNINGLRRRAFLEQAGAGVGIAALAKLLGQDLGALETPRPRPHFAPKAKRVIYLFQNGGPTHADLFDWKPELAARHGEPIPESFVSGKRFSTMTGNATGKRVLGPVEPFAQHGQSGAWVSQFLPYTAKVADDLCFIKSLYTDAVNHAPAISFLLSGAQIPERPTLGAWMSYGLGNPTEDLPAYVVMTSVSKGTTCGQIFYDFYWSSGFLPSRYQGVKFRGSGTPALYLENPPGLSRGMRRGQLDDLAALNQLHHDRVGDPEILNRIEQYEMAFKMQASVPELTDLSDESEATLKMYGPAVREKGSFAYNCLMARRLVERGVHCVQLMHAGWDQHNSITTELYNQCRDTDQPSAALVQDLKARGLLEDTLVIWGGEFGRTPFIQGDLGNRPRWGRDHHPYAFTIWMAGGGVQPGLSYGASDPFAMNAVENPVHVHDLQATVLDLLGLDHERLTFAYRGRRFRLTDVHGKVVREIIS